MSIPEISIDIIITLSTMGVVALILHWNSHVKYIGLGQFVGLVLAQTVATPLYEFLSPKFEWFNSLNAVNFMQLALLLIPTIILGINHTPDKRRMNPVKFVAYVSTVTLSLLANILAYIPDEWRQYLIERSFIALQLYYYRVWLLVAMAIVIIIDSFAHKKAANADKFKGKK